MKRERRYFDKEFKEMVVNLCLSGKPPKEIADELGIRSELVRRWKREHEQFGAGSFSGHGNVNMTPEQKEIAKLKKMHSQNLMEAMSYNLYRSPGIIIASNCKN